MSDNIYIYIYIYIYKKKGLCNIWKEKAWVMM